MKILCLGEIMLELAEVKAGVYQRNFAGDSFNLAYYLRLASHKNIQVDYLTAVGTDSISDECLSFITKHGIGIQKCSRNPQRTLGLFLLSNNEKGEKQYYYWRGQSAVRVLFNQAQDLTGYDWVCLSGITAAVTENKDLLLSCVHQAQQKEALIVYDFNHRQPLWNFETAQQFAKQILPWCSFVKISDEELGWLYPDSSISILSQLYPNSEWVLTQGNQPSEAWQNGRLLACAKFEPLKSVVDSSAAGDSFLAAYLAARAQGKDWKVALANGNQIAGQVVQIKGSIVSANELNLHPECTDSLP